MDKLKAKKNTLENSDSLSFDEKEGKVVIGGASKINTKDEHEEFIGNLDIESNDVTPKNEYGAKSKFKKELVDQNIILSVRHLKQFFFFGSKTNQFKLKAVHDISFDIKTGECMGLVGESGCGKTTTGRSIIRLYKITSGSVYYKGYRITGGVRWNVKEIKFTKIRLKQKIKDLKNAEKEENLRIASGLSQKEFDAINQKYRKIVDDYKDAHKFKENEKPSFIDKEMAKLKLQQITMKAEKDRINELKNLITETDPAKLNEVREKYDALRAEEKQKAKAICDEQKKKIKRIKYDNRHVSKKLMSEIQMIFQDPIDSLDPRMTVEDIIQEGLRIQGNTNRAENHRKVVDVLEKVGLIEEYASRYPHEFSGGQRQRVGIARALVMNPKLLICDEPISALDVSIRAQIINLLNDLKQEMGLTMLFIAHDLSVVKYFCDKIAVMYFGELVELASSDELFSHPLHPYTKALLSAIPKPDPLSEKVRIRKTYNPQTDHDYSKEKPTLVEILPGHFILANSAEVEKYKKEISELDKINSKK